ncbi:MAG: ATP-dependent DNA helicase RecG [Candidatus Margulisbacteria bacterium]|jgi:ATP-dependent DNA helicase RecG|nr:ATP-dependent DNA helicase RecG [Candidatus Margulisiibacteriota bacterium]
MSIIKLETPLQYLKGVGPRLAAIFAKVGVRTIEDLLYFVPRAYEDRRNLLPIVKVRPNELVVVKGDILRVESQRTRSRFSVLKVYLSDKTATIQAVWFNQPYLTKLFRRGVRLIVSGKVEYSQYDGLLQLQVRDFEIDTGETLPIVPKYHLTEGLYPKKLRAVIASALALGLPLLTDEKIRAALLALHQPKELTVIEPARQYLAYEELFLFQLGILLNRQRYHEELQGKVLAIAESDRAEFQASLSFKYTAAQQRVLEEIVVDLRSGRPMNRLLQGDVGSGKTVIAAEAAYLTVRNGLQAIVLAPTEILANQHYKKMTELLKPLKCRVALLTAATSSEEQRAKVFKADVIVGTHALLEENVRLRELGLVVIDEQHRFGVHQRAALIKKGSAPHTLVMTATPIPRSLALTLYGDLDRSVIDELPPGRTAIKTYYVPESKRSGANDFIRHKISEGRQVFVVCPLVEESSELDLKAAEGEAERLQKQVFPEFQVGLIHGRLKSDEKEAIMKAFLKNKLQLLVSTTVIEVGIDVPNATVMVIEHAERFGLAQLHQLRGRVGRGGHESYCFLIGNPKTEIAKARIKAMLESTDGFKIAEEDLRLRGPGEMLGSRQSGLPDFRVADIIRDEKLLQTARAAARELIEKEPEIARHRWESQGERLKNSQEKLEHTAFN